MARYERHENTSAHWKTGQHVSEIVFEGTTAELDHLRKALLSHEAIGLLQSLCDMNVSSPLRASTALAV